MICYRQHSVTITALILVAIAMTSPAASGGVAPARSAPVAGGARAVRPTSPSGAVKPIRPLQAPASRPAQTTVVPVETLRTVFQNLQKSAAAAEGKAAPAALAGALENYRKMQQMIDRFPELRVDASYKALVAQKVAELQPRVLATAQEAAARERADRAARSAAHSAGAATLGTFAGFGGGAVFGGGGGGGSILGGGGGGVSGASRSSAGLGGFGITRLSAGPDLRAQPLIRRGGGCNRVWRLSGSILGIQSSTCDLGWRTVTLAKEARQ